MFISSLNSAGSKGLILDIKSDNINNMSVDSFMHDSFVALDESLTVDEALVQIRKIPDNNQVLYFYTKDSQNRLTGVVPARALLTSDTDQKLKQISLKDIIKVNAGSTMLEVAQIFANYKYLSLPVVDEDDQVIGVVDLKPFTRNKFDISNKILINDIFQAIGFRVSRIINAGALKSFRYRFPWLMSTVTSGLICAFLAGVFEYTLVKSIILAFFITTVLALGESVSIQSMSLSLQLIYVYDRVKLKRYFKILLKEILVGILLGTSCAVVVFTISFVWKHQIISSVVIGSSIFASVFFAVVIGITIPILMHNVQKDPRIASGPLVLALTDICTILLYFLIAQFVVF